MSNSGTRLAMMITPDRIAYYGLFGAPSRRTHGAVTVYVALESSFQIRIGAGERESAWLALVPANTPHEITTRDRLIADVLIEPECVRWPQMRAFPRSIVTTPTTEYVRVRDAFVQWLAGNQPIDPSPEIFDRFSSVTRSSGVASTSGLRAPSRPSGRNPATSSWRPNAQSSPACPSRASFICSRRRSA